MGSSSERVIADTESAKQALKNLVETAIRLNVKSFVDVITFTPPLQSSDDIKWRMHWRAVFDTLNIYFEGKGYYFNIQKAGRKREGEPMYYQTVSEFNLPHCSYASYLVIWNRIETKN